jgi:hypothetical protein
LTSLFLGTIPLYSHCLGIFLHQHWCYLPNVYVAAPSGSCTDRRAWNRIPQRPYVITLRLRPKSWLPRFFWIGFYVTRFISYHFVNLLLTHNFLLYLQLLASLSAC